ncbi:uncharacterized protein LOC126802674 [Argentina anserina]|uniref:uncharacterized protein LOC126802674 n=1 Tax=Argentina anserina TaxID=57926 RepID=UPI0021764895|nr:uncharacterized protein LOC126802674 [Potentilla anserina]
MCSLSAALRKWNRDVSGSVFGTFFLILSMRIRINFLILFSLLDVKDALFSIGPLKASGYDGFPTSFYQHHWQLYSRDIYSIACNAFTSGCIPSGLNHTIISLIPKVDGPQHMVNFKPISLCSTIYKVISKHIVAKLRPLMMKLISSNQVLCEIKLPYMLIKLIMRCVFSTSFQICFNDDLIDGYKAQRRIRQGDPLSPYLFVLCIEKLSHLIKSAVDYGSWKAVKASQSGPRISHLFFADDLMLFAEASSRQASGLKGILDTLCSLSGQAVSYEKSLIFCSPNIDRRLANILVGLVAPP